MGVPDYKRILLGLTRDCYSCRNKVAELSEPEGWDTYSGRKKAIRKMTEYYKEFGGQQVFPFFNSVHQLPAFDPDAWSPDEVKGDQQRLMFPVTWRMLSQVEEVAHSTKYGGSDLRLRGSYRFSDQKTELPTNCVYVCVTQQGRMLSLGRYDRSFVGVISSWKWGHRHFKLTYSDWIEDWKEVLQTLRAKETKDEIRGVVVASELGKHVPSH